MRKIARVTGAQQMLLTFARIKYWSKLFANSYAVQWSIKIFVLCLY